MKNYTIWLKGGNCINGTMENIEAARLKSFCQLRSFCKNLDQLGLFEDTGGEIILNSDEIAAIAISKENTEKTVGFN